MALRPDEFYDHALTAADGERRLPLARMTEWGISPFEQNGLRVAPLRPPVLPEPGRHDEDPSDCHACRNQDEGVWFNDRWRLSRIKGVGIPLALMLYPRGHYDMADLPDELAAELGVLSTHLVRHVEALPHIARAHVYRLGDGGAHLITFHPRGGSGSAEVFHDAEWLDFNMRQNGHAIDFTGRYDQTRVDYDRTPIKPVIDAVLPLDQAAEAHRRMQAGEHSGKLLLAL